MAIVANKIPHEHIDHIVVDRERRAKSGHGKSL
jgi:hypothetical protein